MTDNNNATESGVNSAESMKTDIPESTTPAESEPVASKEGDTKIETKEVAYTDFTLPEGMTLDETDINSFKEYAKGLGLNQEQAQKALERDINNASSLLDTMKKDFEVTLSEQDNTFKTDKEFGGVNLEKSLKYIDKAGKYLGEPFTKALKETFGDRHPDILKGLAKMGRELSDDTFVTGNSGKDGKGRTIYDFSKEVVNSK